MTVLQADKIIEIAGDFWPKATESELKLFREMVEELDFEKVKTILKDTKKTTRYLSLPFKEISVKLSQMGVTASPYIVCYYLNQTTGKHGDIAALASDPEEARRTVMDFIYKKLRQEPNDFTLFIGKENCDLFHRAVHNWLWDNDAAYQSNLKQMRQQYGIGVVPELF